MKTINKSQVHTTARISLVLFAALLSLSIPFAQTHALSCLNPTEMISDYVTDERFAIALVTAGEIETEGSGHEQVVTVTENYKGTTNTPVSFTFDDTWSYLCAGNPAEVGTEAVYVTSDGTVSQVINLDSELYDSIMTALSDTPAVTNPPDENEVKRTLMQRIINLLQQVVSLLTGEPTPPALEPEPTPSVTSVIGMTVAEAESYTEANDILFRVVEIDGEPQEITEDYRPGRINASVENDVVVSYEVEGEEPVEEETVSHDDIIGMTQAEAEAYAAENDVLFRIGRIDEEYLPVTMDYRPGRITAEIEDGVVVDYSVE